MNTDSQETQHVLYHTCTGLINMYVCMYECMKIMCTSTCVPVRILIVMEIEIIYCTDIIYSDVKIYVWIDLN